MFAQSISPKPLLEVRDLVTHFDTEDGPVYAVNGVSFTVYEGEVLALVGESGSGKSVTMLSVMGLIPQPPGKIVRGSVMFNGRDLRTLSNSQMRSIRGQEIAMVFQDPMASLNPVLTVGKQISEAIRLHRPVSSYEARERSLALLKLVGIPDAKERIDDYPHQFSGGMRQRVMIAMALSCNPKLLIADEPTTALDVTIQAQIVELVKQLQQELGMAVIWITHDLGLVANLADRVAVMYAGRIAEQGDLNHIYVQPRHPYTMGLLGSIPRLSADVPERLQEIGGMPPDLIHEPTGCAFAPRCFHTSDKCLAHIPELEPTDVSHSLSACWHWDDLSQFDQGSTTAVVTTTLDENESLRKDQNLTGSFVRIEGLKTYFPIRKGIFQRQVGTVRAVDGVDLIIQRGETLGLVGESGCGKTTLGRSVLRLYEPNEGKISFDGQELTSLKHKEMRGLRRRMQMIFQDPYSSMNPGMRVWQIVGEPLKVHGLGDRDQIKARTAELLERVGLNPSHIDRHPHEFSGGQRQRIVIARALSLNPDFIICDEPVSSLDVSVQAQIINLLEELQRDFDLTYLFIAHDLAVVRHISDRVAVMYLGKIVEIGTRDGLYAHPLHPYTKALLSSVPIPDPIVASKKGKIVLKGDLPSPVTPPSGCRFHTRCPIAVSGTCDVDEPELRAIQADRSVACHFV